MLLLLLCFPRVIILLRGVILLRVCSDGTRRHTNDAADDWQRVESCGGTGGVAPSQVTLTLIRTLILTLTLTGSPNPQPL